MRKKIFLAVILMASITQTAFGEMQKTNRVILFVIDGLHWQAPEKLNLQNFNQLKTQGAYIQKACMILPYHPLTGDWAKIHNSSMPNPVMLTGSLFITPEHKLIQEMFPRESLTAHCTNSNAYISVGRNFNISFIDDTTDDKPIEFAIEAFKKYDIQYMRIHLQDTGTGGWQCSTQKEPVAWNKNIWAEGSPYIKNALKADELLGLFVKELKSMGKWDDTLLIVTADHGQAKTGWHPTLDEDSQYTPLLFVGPSIAKNKQIDYAEHIDIIPTICSIMNIQKPVKIGSGRVLKEISSNNQNDEKHTHFTQIINNQLISFEQLKSKMILSAQSDPYLENVVLVAERDFYSLDRFTDWHNAGSLENLIKQNKGILENMQTELSKSSAKNFVKTGSQTFTTFYDVNQPAFENSLIAFRCYAQGWGLDMFGKTEAGKKLTLKNFMKLQEPIVNDIHSLNDIGMDIFHIGQTAGLGRISIIYKNKEYIPAIEDTKWEMISNNGSFSIIIATAPIKINDQTLAVQRTFTIYDEDRLLDDKIQIIGSEKIIANIQIAIGLTMFAEKNTYLDEKTGSFISYGTGTENGVKEIGLALKFNPKNYIRLNKSEDSAYVILEPDKKNNIAEIHQKLTYYWNLDHTIKTKSQMIDYLDKI